MNEGECNGLAMWWKEMSIKLRSQNLKDGTHLENLDVDVITKFKKKEGILRK
jgi:hypothetical protein